MFDENNTTNPSFFANMAMKFRTTESCDVNVDSVLADTVNDLFCNGLDEEHYNKIATEVIRPANVDSLATVKINQLIWVAVSPLARSTDKKLLNIEESVVKSGRNLVKIVDKEGKKDSDSLAK